jgi:hypothetical protein
LYLVAASRPIGRAVDLAKEMLGLEERRGDVIDV